MQLPAFINMFSHHRIIILKFALLCLVCVSTFEQKRFDLKEKLEHTFKEMEDCPDPLNMFSSEDPVLVSVTNKKDMDELCEEIKQHLACIDKKTKRSMTPESQVTFKVLYNSTATVMKELCENEMYQQEFLKHARCINNMKNDCETKYLKTLEEIQMGPRDQHAWRKICCSFQEYHHCSNRTVRVACGQEAGNFFMKTLDAMATSVKQQCHHVPDFPDTCEVMNLAPKIFHEVTWLNMLLVALTLILPTLLI